MPTIFNAMPLQSSFEFTPLVIAIVFALAVVYGFASALRAFRPFLENIAKSAAAE